MRKITVIVLMLFTALSYAQVGINIATPHASSALDITSTTGGLLVPRMTEVQRDDINSSSNPAIGLMIYQTDGIAGFYFWNGSAWTKIDGVAGPQGADGADGAQGPAGPAGVVGSAGPVGSTGAQGLAGPVGTQGPAGAQGPAGPVGPQGIQGIQGDIGLTGATGPQGEAGADGNDGATGPAGPAGADGADGNDGAAGPAGADGASYTQPTYLNNTFYAELGGYVIEVNSDGTHGLVVAMQDQSYSNWYEADDLLSNAANHDTNGAKFKDWRLPTKRELNLMYGVYTNGNGASLNPYTYWSSTGTSSNYAWVHYFINGDQDNEYKINSLNVRAVRAF